MMIMLCAGRGWGGMMIMLCRGVGGWYDAHSVGWKWVEVHSQYDGSMQEGWMITSIYGK